MRTASPRRRTGSGTPAAPVLRLAPEPEHLNEDLWRDFRRDLIAEGLRPSTVSAYHDGFKSLWDWSQRDLLSLARTDIQDWIAVLFARGFARSTISGYFRDARRFYGWAAAENLIGASPMEAMKAPPVGEIPVVIPPLADIRKVLAACEADKSRKGLRDTAIVRLWGEAGSPRASEMAHLAVTSFSPDTDTVTVTDGKGGRTRTFRVCAKTARAIARWLRARRTHPYADRPELFLGQKGAMTAAGMFQLLETRCAQAGVPRIHPHQMRHYASHTWQAAGGSAVDLGYQIGWSRTTAVVMAARYGAALAGERAGDAARALAIGNQL